MLPSRRLGGVPGVSFDLFRMQDHVFDLEAWWRPKDFNEFGPEAKVREYSVLENPRMPEVCALLQLILIGGPPIVAHKNAFALPSQ